MTTVLSVTAVGALFPVMLYICAKICTRAYFEEKLVYQTNFLKKFDSTKSS